MTFNPAIATIKAARAAAAQRKANVKADTPVPRTGQRTQQAIDALICLRRDVALGLPVAALLDRIDDELFKLKR